MGFSAGGHLASCAGTLYDAPEGRTGVALDVVSARPDFLLLIYPVITMKEPYTHAGSRRNLLGPSPSPESVDHLSTEMQVTKNTPPAFLLTTYEDGTVPEGGAPPGWTRPDSPRAWAPTSRTSRVGSAKAG